MSISLVDRVAAYSGRLAVVDERGEHSYDDLLAASAAVALTLLDGESDLDEARVAFMVAPGCSYVAVQWGIWRAGGIAVPLCLSHPAPELDYVLEDTGAAIIVADPVYEERLAPLAEARGIRLIRSGIAVRGEVGGELPHVGSELRAMIL
jgi:malonyl-CoA/methylmalonyl-CoA synthetase